MTQPTLYFTSQEYAARIAKTRTAMQAAGLELLIVSDPSNMAWLTGYDGWSFYVHQAVLLGLDGDPVWFGRGQDANGAKRTVLMKHSTSSATPIIMCNQQNATQWITCLRKSLTGGGAVPKSALKWTITGFLPQPLPA